MIQLLHKSNFTTNKLTGIRKVVYDQINYIDEDTILYLTDEKINIHNNVKRVITNSLSIFNRYKDEKEVIHLDNLDMIEENSIVRIERDIVYFTFLPSSNSHALFLTKKCNHYCLMCSEPPSTKNDDYLIEENLKIIELIDKNLEIIGITGGEATLLGQDFIKIIQKIRKELPNTLIRLLTNGRSYINDKFVKQIAECAEGYIVSEIPIYSSNYNTHDYIVQSKGAFFETIEGFYNCAKYNLTTEVRVVLTKQNYMDLKDLVYFIYRNLPFIDHIALMGLEYIGFALENFDDIHVEPSKYQKNINEAIHLAKKYSLPISIYNLPLCLLDKELRSYARQSISDWKNEFAEVCDNCIHKSNCSGMFTSTKPYFENLLNPIYD